MALCALAGFIEQVKVHSSTAAAMKICLIGGLLSGKVDFAGVSSLTAGMSRVKERVEDFIIRDALEKLFNNCTYYKTNESILMS
jgi:hypothetical protein